MIQKITIMILIIIYFTGCVKANRDGGEYDKSLFSVWSGPEFAVDFSNGDWDYRYGYNPETDEEFFYWADEFKGLVTFSDGSQCQYDIEIESSFQNDGSVRFLTDEPECQGIFQDQVKFSHFNSHQTYGTSLHMSLNPTEVLR